MVYKKKKTLISNIANLSYLACGVGFSFTQFYLLQKLLLHRRFSRIDELFGRIHFYGYSCCISSLIIVSMSGIHWIR